MVDKNLKSNLKNVNYKNWIFLAEQSAIADFKKYINLCEKNKTLLCVRPKNKTNNFFDKIITLSVPANITKMQPYALANYINLQYVTISGCKEIADYAFYNNNSLNVVIIDNAEIIGSHAFENAGSLNSNDMQLAICASNVKNVKSFAFQNSGIQEFGLSSKSNLTLETNAIINCPRLEFANFPTITQLNSQTFDNNQNLKVIITPKLKSFNPLSVTNCNALKKVVVSQEAKQKWNNILNSGRLLNTNLANLQVLTQNEYENLYKQKIISNAKTHK